MSTQVENNPNSNQLEQLAQFAELMEREIEAYSQMLEIEREKERAIVSNDPQLLLELLQRQEPVVNRANSLERRIFDCRGRLAAAIGGDTKMTLREIAARLPATQAEKLNSLRVTLFGYAEEIRRINQMNYMLLRQSVEMLDEVIGAILGETPCNTYAGDGRVRQQSAACGQTLHLKA